MSNQLTHPNYRERIMAVAAGGICLALAEVLSLVKIFEMPQGGSVTLASMLPIILYAFCFGPVWGIAVAFLYSLLQTFIGGYILSPMQVLLDYTLAFTALGFAGFFAARAKDRIEESNILHRLRLIPEWKMTVVTFGVVAIRLLCSFLSGIIFYADYAPEGQAVWIYSLIYNGSFLLPEAIITVSVLFVLLGSLFLKKEEAEVISVSYPRWLLTFLIALIPIIGQVYLIVWAFDKKNSPSRRTWAQAVLTLLGALSVLWILLSLIHKSPYIPFG